jgi:hypothetical protein
MIGRTRHATARMQQRSIPPLMLDWLLAYGARAPAGDGCERLYFDKPGRRRLQRYIGSWTYGRLAEKLDIYAVVNRDGALVTSGYCLKHIRRR